MDGILAGYSGFKLHTYQLDSELLAHLLLRQDLYIVFLRRRNLLEAVVSNLIAEQTGLWSAWDRDRDFEAYYTELAPVSLEDARALLRWSRENLTEVADLLQARRDGRAIQMFYEDMFVADVVTRLRQAESLWSHLGLPPCTNPRVGAFLDNESFRMGGPATYGRLPNLAELEAALGNDETGHIAYRASMQTPAAEGLEPARNPGCATGGKPAEIAGEYDNYGTLKADAAEASPSDREGQRLPDRRGHQRRVAQDNRAPPTG